MTLDSLLLELLVCPEDKGPLLHLPGVLYNPRLRRRYEIRDGIPVLLVDEAQTITDDAEHDKLIADAAQASASEEPKARP